MNNRKRILIADPSQDFQSYLTVGLEKQPGLEVVGAAADGYSAIDMIVALHPDIVLMDVLMPKLDGLGVMRALNSMEIAPKPAIFILSSFTTDSLASHAAVLGAQYFVVKPFDISALVDMLRFDVAAAAAAHADENLEAKVTSLLHDVGIPSHIRGFYYIREAILVAMRDRDSISAITKILYPNIAETFATTPSRVERAIRHAIEVAWDRGCLDTQYELFRNTVSSKRGKPTNSEFIATVADKLQLQAKTKAINL